MELILLTLLILKHTVADFFLQRSFMFKDKHIYASKGGVTHALIHGGLTTLVLLVIFPKHVLFAYLVGIVDTILHYHIDYVKSSWNVKTQATTNENRYWYAFGLDQLAHMLTYIAIVFFIFY